MPSSSFLTQRYGDRHRDWTLKRQDLLRVGAKTYDTYQIVLADGSERSLYFDVTEWIARTSSYFITRQKPEKELNNTARVALR